MANSIRDNLGVHDTISEIRLLLGKNKNNVCVVVEGINDQKLFEPLLADNTTLVQSYSGKKDIINIIKCFPRNKRVIGIRDRDYSKSSESKRVFFCDYSCAEMMIISLDECFRRTYSNFYAKQTLSFKDLRLYCLEHLEQLSKIRKLNELNNWNINFKTVKLKNIFNDDIIKMNKNLFDQIIRCRVNHVTRKQLNKSNSYEKCGSLEDYLDITNGHDFIEMFKISCDEGGRESSIDEIAANIRGTFGIHEFRQTRLYSALYDYQSKKNLALVN